MIRQKILSRRKLLVGATGGVYRAGGAVGCRFRAGGNGAQDRPSD